MGLNFNQSVKNHFDELLTFGYGSVSEESAFYGITTAFKTLIKEDGKSYDSWKELATWAIAGVSTLEDIPTPRVVEELTDLMIRKQKDYGPKNILSFGLFGVLVRANDKIQRIDNLRSKGTKPENESYTDSWRDIANYAVIAMMLSDKQFDLPLEDAA